MKASPFDLSGKGRHRHRWQRRHRPRHGARSGPRRRQRRHCWTQRSEVERRGNGITPLGVKALPLNVDVTDKASVTSMVDATLSAFGQLDILINNAGINIRGPADTLDLNDWHKVIDTNLTSAFLCAQAVYPAMKAIGGGEDHQCRLDDVDLRRRISARLCRQHIRRTCGWQHHPRSGGVSCGICARGGTCTATGSRRRWPSASRPFARADGWRSWAASCGPSRGMAIMCG